MRHHLRTGLTLLVPLFAPTDHAAAQLHPADADADLRQVIARTHQLLTRSGSAEDHDQAGADAARRVLGLLRLGEPLLARAELQRSLLRWRGEHPPRPTDTAWLLAALAWYTRASDDDSLRAQWLAHGQRLLAATEREELPAAYAEAALLVHGHYCAALLADRAEAAANQRRLATRLLLQLECETWQPGRGHYRPRRTDGELVVPQAADGSLLLPVSAGMLVATGNRLTRHLQATLACSRSGDARRWRDDTPPTLLAPLQLIAAAQLGDPAAMATCYRQVLAERSDDAAIASLQLDALLFATTGIRLAIGIGVDESFQRVSPWLPPGVDRIDLEGLLVRGRRLRLRIERSPADAGLQVEITAATHGVAEPLPLVVGNARRQFLTSLDGQPFWCELPPRESVGPRSEAQDEAATRDPGLGRR